MKVLKAFLYGFCLGGILPPLVELVIYKGMLLPTILWWGVCVAGFGLGWYLSRFVSWGWTLGGLLGMCGGGFAPIPLMSFAPETHYEGVIPWLLISGCGGLIIGGYVLNRFFKSRARQTR